MFKKLVIASFIASLSLTGVSAQEIRPVLPGVASSQELAAAAEWYKKAITLTEAAHGGAAVDQLALARHYDPRYAKPANVADARTATTWYLRAALQGSLAAQNALGELYASEEGNPVMAYTWLSIAKKKRLDSSAKAALESVTARLTDEQKANGTWFANELINQHPAITAWN